MIVRRAATLISVFALLILGACAVTPNAAPEVDKQKIADLTQEILGLGPEVDAEEAARAARIAVEYPRQLAQRYQITDPPLIHNMKVNNGSRPRGLCYQWADDLEARLRQEAFKTLDLHRAIANADNAILIDHSTTLISRRGDTLYQGIVLDPWRYGGRLFWSPTLADTRYHWVPRTRVFAQKRQQRAAVGRRLALETVQ